MKPVQDKDWKRDDYVAIALMSLTAEELSSKHDLTFHDVEEDGLGNTRLAALRLDNGRQFILQQFLDAPEPYKQQTEIICLNNPRTMKTDLLAICDALKIETSSLTWTHPSINPARHKTLKKAKAPKFSR